MDKPDYSRIGPGGVPGIIVDDDDNDVDDDDTDSNAELSK